MRLFGKVDGEINRFDRAMYLTRPFDLSWRTVAVVVTIESATISPRIAARGKAVPRGAVESTDATPRTAGRMMIDPRR